MRTLVRNLLLVALAIGLLAWFLRDARLDLVWREIERADVRLLWVALGTMGLNLLLRAARWRYLLAPIGRVSFGNATRATIMGFAASTVLPARAGEVLRPYVLARREGLSATSAFATIIVERLLDTLTVVFLVAAFGLLFDPGPTIRGSQTFVAIRVGAALVGAAALGGLLVTFVAAGRPAALAAGAMRLERVLPRAAATIAGLLRKFAEGLAVVRSPWRLATAILMSLPLWLSIAAGIWTVSVAFHIALPFAGSFLLMALLVLGVAVPTPGAVGGFHEAFRIGATTFYAASNERAVGAALVLHALSFLPVTALGLALAVHEGLSLWGVRRLEGLAEEDGGRIG
jgi:glycosyltransferase 2 family protein